MSNLRSIKKVNKQNCFSCRSCFLICPIQAISMEETKEGFFFPKVSDQCTNCGLCSIHCPSLNPIIENNFKKESYAAYLNNSELLHRSSSGGLFAGFAKKIIDDGGVVFGAAYDNNLFVNQIVAFNHNEVEQIKESKYVESNTNSSFSQVKELLSQYTVLYSGCPCQIAGLKKFLGKEYFNLITIDLICHGVPSQKLFHKYLQFKESEFGDKILSYKFRNKKFSCDCVKYAAAITSQKTIIINANSDPYFASFLRFETYRESCYSCPYSSMKRPADITIGDFFEINKINPEFDKSKGVSLCIINTEKGKKLFGSIKNDLTFFEVKPEQYLKYKGNLVNPSPRPIIRNSIYEGIDLTPKTYFSKYKETKLYFKFYKWVISKIPKNIKIFLNRYLQ